MQDHGEFPRFSVAGFCQAFPDYAFDFERRIVDQPRIYDADTLADLPLELIPGYEYQAGGRGRANRNQTRTHSQCATCYRVLRNDCFFTPASMVTRNVVYSHCKECAKQLNAQRYETTSELVRLRREALWSYLAPQCELCGFDKHISALDMHHLEGREARISDLITYVALAPDGLKAERLLREVRNCVPLCSNCHRMVHAGALELPANLQPAEYRLVDIMRIATESLPSPESTDDG